MRDVSVDGLGERSGVGGKAAVGADQLREPRGAGVQGLKHLTIGGDRAAAAGGLPLLRLPSDGGVLVAADGGFDRREQAVDLAGRGSLFLRQPGVLGDGGLTVAFLAL
ncbi:MAG: hypothetical protein KDC98_08185, partial [Planctomycetes bacterium]|nr:hypothetical protein [Planctomycetota bacterium]